MRFFVHLWDRGWIYRANRIVNWCPFHETAISDLEVEHVDMDDTLTYARYPFADGSGHIVIATVRPATMLADVAVAVHPDDERYRDAIGKQVARPVRRARGARDRRRAGRAGVRHRRAQGHARPRSDRLRDRPRPRARDDHRDRSRRADERERRRPRREDAAGGRRGDSRVAEGARPDREAGALPPLGRHVRALPHADRAARVAAVVGGDGGAAQAGAAGVAGAARALPPRVAAPVRDPLARGDPGLEHLQAALVGSPAAALVLPGRPRHVRLAAARRVRGMRLDRARARPRRARHLVLVGALAVRDARLARADARARALLPRRCQLDRARDHPPLGEPDDLDRARADGGDPVHGRDHPLDDPGRRRPPDVEEPRQRRRPARPDREARRRRDALRAPEDVLDPGRALRGGLARRGPKAREQALERLAAAAPAAGRA